MEQLTKEQAIAFAESGVWKEWTNEQIVRFQLFQDKMCMPFSRFHEAITKVLGREIWTHEFAFIDEIKKEYLGAKDAPTFEEIVNLIPEEKRLIIGINE
jgi:hypothetical protein